MRIGINALFFIPEALGGVGVYTRNLVGNLLTVTPEHNFVLFVSRESRDYFKEHSGRLEIVTLPTPAKFRPSRIITEQLLLPIYAYQSKLDLLHSLGYTAPLISPCPSIVSILDMNYRHWPQSFSKLSVLMQNLLIPPAARRSQHIITISHFSKQVISKELKLPQSKISAIHLAYNKNLFYSALQDKIDKQQILQLLQRKYGISTTFILSIASSHPHKNLDGLIKAYALLRTKHSISQQLVLVGHKRRANQKILKLIVELGLQNKVILTGFVPDEDLPLLYTFADVFVFPSFYEGFGIPLLEAMACGVPVVSSKAGSLPEIGGDAALYVNPFDIEDICRGILETLRNKKLSQKLVERGKHRIQLFSWEKTAQKTLLVYEKFCNKLNMKIT